MTALDDETATRFQPSRFCWDTLDREAAQHLWAELIDWVGWLRVRYELPTEIPGCWYRHTRMVEELTALMTAHRAAYDTANTADGEVNYWSGMAAWHTQYLRPFLAHLGDFGVAGCTPQECTAQPRNVHTYRDIIDWIDADVDARRPRADNPPPAPATITPAKMADLLSSGNARPADLADPTGGYLYEGTVWLLDPRRKVFVAQPEPTTGLDPDTPTD